MNKYCIQHQGEVPEEDIVWYSNGTTRRLVCKDCREKLRNGRKRIKEAMKTQKGYVK